MEGSVDLRLDTGSETAGLQVAGSWEEEHAKYFLNYCTIFFLGDFDG